jgi:predicted RNase H-like HicB family nuclease
VSRWNLGLESETQLRAKLPYHQHFYFIPDPANPETGHVGPSKFIGYRLMTVSDYIDRTRLPASRGGLDGGASERQLSRSRLFRELAPGTDEHRLVHSIVEALLRRFGASVNRRAKMHAPQDWSVPAAAPAVVRESRAAYEAPAHQRRLQRNIHALVRPGEDGYFVAECVNLAVVTQGKTIDETIANLREAVGLHLDGEDLTSMGLAPDPVIVVTMELEPAVA